MGAMLKFGSEGAKQFYDMFVLNPELRRRLTADGDIHIHDMDFYTLTTTCCQIDLHQAVHRTASPPATAILREPNDIASYAALACIAIQSNQNDQHGGQSIVNFDYGMADGRAQDLCRKRYRGNLARGAGAAGRPMDDAEDWRRSCWTRRRQRGRHPHAGENARPIWRRGCRC